MPEPRTAFLIGVGGSSLPALTAGLAEIGYEISETAGTIALAFVQNANDDRALLAITEAKCPVIAIIKPGDSELLHAVALAGARGILDLPIRRSAIEIQVALACAAIAHQRRLENKATLLERTLKSRNIVEKATQVVATVRGINRADAYEHLRRTSMNGRISMAEAAENFLVKIEAAAGSDPSM